MAANSLAYQFKTSSIAVKIIAINAVIFLLISLTSFFGQIAPISLTRWFVLPDGLPEFILQPWSFITYAFIHYGFWHLLFNMYMLYWFSNIVLNLFDSKRYLTIYLLGAMSGGLLYVLSYNIFPVFLNSSSYLLGASGAVMAIVIFIATYTPNTELRIFTWTIKLWHIAAVIFLIDLVRLPISGNAGGLLAHIGGAILGYSYAIQLAKGNDIGLWFTKLISWVEDVFKPRTKKPFKKVHRTTQTTPKRSKQKPSKTETQKKVDDILDKIGKSGYESLTKAEKDFLFKAGKED
ncbi:rhomboid family intramembrane serine protease [Jejudonia soesokkakensis]|uniref:Rhomboid family intramembrane serine protease n=1 Tax=Jejudonia soesokkakensis TaxID=1323432 RepID=A0ABW2MVR9_9FLAO